MAGGDMVSRKSRDGGDGGNASERSIAPVIGPAAETRVPAWQGTALPEGTLAAGLGM